LSIQGIYVGLQFVLSIKPIVLGCAKMPPCITIQRRYDRIDQFEAVTLDTLCSHHV